LMEKLTAVEAANTGLGQRISDLECSETSLRDSIGFCQTISSSTYEQVESIKNALDKIWNQMEIDRKASSATRSELDTVQKDLNDVKGAIEKDRADCMKRVAESKEKLINEMKSMEVGRGENGEV
ncbi:hypothetical protein PFISCL1PPCAC_25788, partial [Pristionchus fissidentatus]